MKVCKNCGKELEENDKFCKNCGTKYEETEEKENTKEEVAKEEKETKKKEVAEDTKKEEKIEEAVKEKKEEAKKEKKEEKEESKTEEKKENKNINPFLDDTPKETSKKVENPFETSVSAQEPAKKPATETPASVSETPAPAPVPTPVQAPVTTTPSQPKTVEVPTSGYVPPQPTNYTAASTVNATNGCAIGSFICALLGFFGFGLTYLLNIAALILGIIGAVKSKNYANHDGRGLSITGIIISSICLIFQALVWILIFAFAINS